MKYRSEKIYSIALEYGMLEKRIYLDEGYIKEKLIAVKDINKWLPRYFQEARDRYTSGTLSDEQRVQMQPYFK